MCEEGRAARAKVKMGAVRHSAHHASDPRLTPQVTSQVTAPLHHRLIESGWNVLVFDAMPSTGDGVREAAKLHAAMAYCATHRKLRYCRTSLLTQGTSASAAMMAMHAQPGRFFSVTALAAFEPSGSATLCTDVLDTYAPACNLPVVLTHRSAAAVDTAAAPSAAALSVIATQPQPNAMRDGQTPHGAHTGPGRTVNEQQRTPMAVQVARRLPAATPHHVLTVPAPRSGALAAQAHIRGEYPPQKFYPSLAFLERHSHTLSRASLTPGVALAGLRGGAVAPHSSSLASSYRRGHSHSAPALRQLGGCEE